MIAGEPSCEHADMGNSGFEGLGEPAAPGEPREGSPHNTAPGQKSETLPGIRAFDDLQTPFALVFQPAPELGTGIAAVGGDLAQQGRGGAEQAQQVRCTVAALDGNRAHLDPNDWAERVGDELDHHFGQDEPAATASMAMAARRSPPTPARSR